MKKEKIEPEIIETDADTRENIMIVDQTTNLHYRFITPGNPVKEYHWRQCLQAVENINGAEYLVVSGSMQAGYPKDIFEQLAAIAKLKDTKLIIDIPGETFKTYALRDTYLLKPNLNELSVLAGKEELNGNQITEGAKDIILKNI